MWACAWLARAALKRAALRVGAAQLRLAEELAVVDERLNLVGDGVRGGRGGREEEHRTGGADLRGRGHSEIAISAICLSSSLTAPRRSSSGFGAPTTKDSALC